MKTKARLFLFLAVTALVTVALAKMAGAQTTTPATPVHSHTVAGYSQGVSASWVEKGVDTTIYTNFSFSFGSDYELDKSGSAQTVNWSQRDPWWNFYQVSCPMAGGACQTLEDESGVAQAGDFVFTETSRAEVSVGGFRFSFAADPLLREARFGSAEENNTTEGPWCWYQRQNRSRRGSAKLATSNGAFFQTATGDYAGAWVDWSSEYGEGTNYILFCSSNQGGGKG